MVYIISFSNEEFENYQNVFTLLNLLNLIPLVIILKNAYAILNIFQIIGSFKGFLFDSLKVVITFVPTQIIYSTVPTFWAIIRLIFYKNFKFIVSFKPTCTEERIKNLNQRL